MVKVKAQPLPKKNTDEAVLESAARVCYYYQQYTFKEAMKLPLPVAALLLRVASVEKARDYSELLAISTAPHSKKGSMVKKLQEKYRGVVNG